MKKKKKIIVVVIVVVIAVVIGALFFIFSQEDTYEYINKNGGYKLTLPNDWENIMNNGISGISTFLYSDEKDLKHVQLYISTHNDNLSSLINMTLDNFNESDTNLSISHHPTKINGLESYVFIITGKEEGEDYLSIINMMFITDGKKCFELSFYGNPASFYYEHEDEINQIINSFTII
jgi:hypothetical protein